MEHIPHKPSEQVRRAFSGGQLRGERLYKALRQLNFDVHKPGARALVDDFTDAHGGVNLKQFNELVWQLKRRLHYRSGLDYDYAPDYWQRRQSLMDDRPCHAFSHLENYLTAYKHVTVCPTRAPRLHETERSDAAVARLRQAVCAERFRHQPRCTVRPPAWDFESDAYPHYRLEHYNRGSARRAGGAWRMN